MTGRSSRRMNKNTNLLISYYLRKKLCKFSNAQKVFHTISFQLCSTSNSKYSFFVSLFEINCNKIQTMSLVLNLYIFAEISPTHTCRMTLEISPTHACWVTFITKSKCNTQLTHVEWHSLEISPTHICRVTFIRD